MSLEEFRGQIDRKLTRVIPHTLLDQPIMCKTLPTYQRIPRRRLPRSTTRLFIAQNGVCKSVVPLFTRWRDRALWRWRQLLLQSRRNRSLEMIRGGWERSVLCAWLSLL